jgi:hypothetical protein
MIEGFSGVHLLRFFELAHYVPRDLKAFLRSEEARQRSERNGKRHLKPFLKAGGVRELFSRVDVIDAVGEFVRVSTAAGITDDLVEQHLHAVIRTAFSTIHADIQRGVDEFNAIVSAALLQEVQQIQRSLNKPATAD